MVDKIQIMIIHGGMTFINNEEYLEYLKTREVSLENTLSWKGKFLSENLGDNFEIIKAKMPLKENAKYEDWKIHFERYIPLLRDNVILIGNSLGGAFLAKYLSENEYPKNILSTYLIAPPYDDSLGGERLCGGFVLGDDLSLLEKNSSNLKLLFSSDDEIVPISHAEKYQAKLKNAKIVIYGSKNGHFFISEFPEIVGMIKEDFEKIS